MNEEYIKESNSKIKRSSLEKRLGSIQVIIKDPLSDPVDLDHVIYNVNKKVPGKFLKYVDYIIIGQFEELKKRSNNAAYMDGAIYVTNEQSDEDDMIDDIVHEVAHAVEENLFLEIYSDGFLESEFLSKRERLFHLLEAEKQQPEYQSFMDPEYSSNFDNYLYYEVGYPVLASLAVNIFYSPYAATSLREYFANGFEAYYHHEDFDRLASISPVLFDKLEKINYNKEK